MTDPIIEHPERLQTEAPGPAERLCLDFFDDIWARGNTDQIHRYLANDFRFTPPPGYAPDRDGYAQVVADIHRAFPDLFADIEEFVAAGDKAAAKWVMEGHHKDAWLGIPPTGNKVRMEGLAFEKVEHGKIVEEYSVQDMTKALPQMGVTDLAGLGT